MSQQTSCTPMHINNRAEGSPEEWEQQEPANPLRTSTMPAIIITDSSDEDTGDTGFIVVAHSDAEGADNDERQDASLTNDEASRKMILVMNPDERTDMSEQPVLVVEDSVELGEVIQATLEGMGHEVFHATHGNHGLDFIKKQSPKLIILDIGLPDINGWQMLELIRNHYEALNQSVPPTIIITAYVDPANRLIGKLQKIYSYIMKPFTPDEIEEVVHEALAKGESGQTGSV